MLSKLTCLFLLILVLPANRSRSGALLIAYAGFAGFQSRLWATKELGLLTKYGIKATWSWYAGLDAPDPGAGRRTAPTSRKSTR